MNAWLIMIGIETLSLRMEKHCANAEKIAAYLAAHKEVAWVSYPTLAGNKYKPLADKYVSGKGGAVLTFGLKKGFDACEHSPSFTRSTCCTRQKIRGKITIRHEKLSRGHRSRVKGPGSRV
jgi:O-acetylhomoserine/O-acetylserine sulfhydrylase-like pyridoxal-dependent enzyme